MLHILPYQNHYYSSGYMFVFSYKTLPFVQYVSSPVVTFCPQRKHGRLRNADDVSSGFPLSYHRVAVIRGTPKGLYCLCVVRPWFTWPPIDVTIEFRCRATGYILRQYSIVAVASAPLLPVGR